MKQSQQNYIKINISFVSVGAFGNLNLKAFSTALDQKILTKFFLRCSNSNFVKSSRLLNNTEIINEHINKIIQYWVLVAS